MGDDQGSTGKCRCNPWVVHGLREPVLAVAGAWLKGPCSRLDSGAIAERAENLARRASLRPAPGRRTLRLPNGDGDIRPARQPKVSQCPAQTDRNPQSDAA